MSDKNLHTTSETKKSVKRSSRKKVKNTVAAAADVSSVAKSPLRGKALESKVRDTVTRSPCRSATIKALNDLHVRLENRVLSLRERTEAETDKKVRASLRKELREAVSHVRDLGKSIKKAEKEVKTRKKIKRNPGSETGLTLRVPVSDDLAAFCGWENGTLRSRIDANKVLCKYIKDNNLQDEKQKRFIHPDRRLKKILSKDKEPLTYTSMQKRISHHFTKVSKNKQ